MNIGQFKQIADGYSGSIDTLTLHLKSVRFVKRSKGADFAIVGDNDCELGAAWRKSGEFGPYLSVKLDGPGLLSPISAIMSLKASDSGLYYLRWSRREPTRTD